VSKRGVWTWAFVPPCSPPEPPPPNLLSLVKRSEFIRPASGSPEQPLCPDPRFFFFFPLAPDGWFSCAALDRGSLILPLLRSGGPSWMTQTTGSRRGGQALFVPPERSFVSICSPLLVRPNYLVGAMAMMSVAPITPPYQVDFSPFFVPPTLRFPWGALRSCSTASLPGSTRF